jgi:hypothetical protein
VKEVLLKNRRMTLPYEVANVFVSISLGNFGGNLYVLPIATKFVSYLLSEEQKENHVSTQQDLQERLERNSEPIAKIITADTTQGGVKGKEIIYQHDSCELTGYACQVSTIALYEML